MIAMLTGEIAEKTLDGVVLDVRGVGYGLYVSSRDHGLSALSARKTFYVYEHIREQSHDLFGFLEKADRQFFEQLLTVNGVGPKMAMSVLSLGEAQTVRQAIVNEDSKFLQVASGVGKRVAERIIVDLKDKIDLQGIVANDLSNSWRQTPLDADEAAQALAALGYRPADAAALLAGIDPALPVEERVKQALRNGSL